MDLVIDIGNSNIVCAAYRDDSLLARFRLQSDSQRTEDEYSIEILTLLANNQIRREEIDSVILGSVVPPLTRILFTLCEKYLKRTPIIVGPWSEMELHNRCDDPASVGADRLANALAARRLFGSPIIVVDFGTATTFDVVGKDGAYLGGAIAPGVIVSAEALSAKAALLQSIEINLPKRAIGANTRDAMLSGVILGYISLTEGMIRRIRDELGSEARVIATGGLAPLIAENTTVIDKVIPDLTLQGFRWMAGRA